MTTRKVELDDSVSLKYDVIEAIENVKKQLEEEEEFDEIWRVKANRYHDGWKVSVIGQTKS